MHTRPVGGMWMLAGRSDSRTWSGLRNPRAVFTARICTPPMTDAPATSLLKMWQSRSRTTSEAGVLARALRGHGFQALDGGVLLPHVVADLGARHGVAHLGGRQRERVGAKIDDVVHDYLRTIGVTVEPRAAGRRADRNRCRGTRRQDGSTTPWPRRACPRRCSPRPAARAPRDIRACAHSP